jgi:hypothetical protein
MDASWILHRYSHPVHKKGVQKYFLKQQIIIPCTTSLTFDPTTGNFDPYFLYIDHQYWVSISVYGVPKRGEKWGQIPRRLTIYV